MSENDDLLTPEPVVEPSFVIQVVKGSPSDDEIAALVAVFSAAAAGSDLGTTGPASPPDLWGTPSLMHRGSPTFAPGAYPHLSHLLG